MCGITGFFNPHNSAPAEKLNAVVSEMADTLKHRGPDDHGAWSDPEHGVALGHRRLSIIDLSPLGHQPMASADGRYTIVYNGEIYNFQDLSEELSGLGHSFNGRSDTEVMLAAFSQWGVESALKKFVGMFAFALWDAQEKTVFLARDRIGEKPLYYGLQGDTFLFGSELKSLMKHSDWRGEIDRDALAMFMRSNRVPAPYSIFKGIKKLVPGTFLACSGKDAEKKQLPEPKAYWSAADAAVHGLKNPFDGSEQEAIDALDELLKDSVRRQMVADVPVGVFLSGGIDSSVTTGVMQSLSDRPVRSFTIGFTEGRFNEAEYAKEVAAHLGTDHTELYVTPQEAMDVIPLLPTMFDEPFADSSQIPTFLVSRMAREQVTVSLSGDAGDELFAGYNHYHFGPRIWNATRRIPSIARRMAASVLLSIPSRAWYGLFNALSPMLSAKYKTSRFDVKLRKILMIMKSDNWQDLYETIVSHWLRDEHVVFGGKETPRPLHEIASEFDDPVTFMMFHELITYLPDDILVKTDRASMGVSLEIRVPLLDHNVVEFAWRIPKTMKIRDGQGKWLLRQVLYKYVPRELIDRPKKGFSVPVEEWIRGPYREWAESLLGESRLKEQGLFRVDLLRRKLEEHVSGKRNWTEHLWTALMFQAWFDEYRGKISF